MPRQIRAIWLGNFGTAQHFLRLVLYYMPCGQYLSHDLLRLGVADVRLLVPSGPGEYHSPL